MTPANRDQKSTRVARLTPIGLPLTRPFPCSAHKLACSSRRWDLAVVGIRCERRATTDSGSSIVEVGTDRRGLVSCSMQGVAE